LGGIRYKADLDFFYTEQAPSVYEGGTDFFYPPNSSSYPFPSLIKENSGGLAFELIRLPQPIGSPDSLTAVVGKSRIAFVYGDGLNYGAPSSFRTLVSLSIGLIPLWNSIQLR